MDAWVWVVLVLVAIVVVVAVLVATGQRQRRLQSEQLRQRFGSEYDRVAAGKTEDERRAAEAQLMRRQMRRDHLDIRSLSSEARQRYQHEWQGIQIAFVDEPEASVAQADELVSRVMRDRGYPVASEFENQAELISVDHPDLVSNYRSAHQVYERSQRHEANTDELRHSLVYYRSLFDDLLAA
jgi:hypothetical protein